MTPFYLDPSDFQWKQRDGVIITHQHAIEQILTLYFGKKPSNKETTE